jgi:hypothetical protein
MDDHPNKVILWTDESCIDINAHKNRKTDCVLMTSTSPQALRVRMRSKNPQKVMVWGLVASDGQKMPLIVIPKGQTVTTASYRTLVLEPMLTWIRERYGAGEVVFMQNGAPAHTSNSTQKFLLEELGAEGFWDKNQWPPSSPDFNPLDFSVWSVLKAKACSRSASSTTTLVRKLKEAWDTIVTADYIRKCCNSVRKRFCAVVQADGGHIEGLINDLSNSEASESN